VKTFFIVLCWTLVFICCFGLVNGNTPSTFNADLSSLSLYRHEVIILPLLYAFVSVALAKTLLVVHGVQGRMIGITAATLAFFSLAFLQFEMVWSSQLELHQNLTYQIVYRFKYLVGFGVMYLVLIKRI
jgi:hypothetical protein